MTNYHALDFKYIKKNGIKISINNGEEYLYLDMNPSIGRRYYEEPFFDSTFIEIKENEIDKNRINFLEVDQRIYAKIELLKDEPLYILAYPKNSQIIYSPCTLKGIRDEAKIIYDCHTIYQSSGSPILSLNTLKVIGINSRGSKNNNSEMNLGYFIHKPINELAYYLEGTPNEIINRKNETGKISEEAKKIDSEIYKEKGLFKLNNQLNELGGIQIKNNKYKANREITINGMKIINDQMKKCICKIHKENESATGFFLKINLQYGHILVLMTNYHVLDDKYIKEKDIIISINNEEDYLVLDMDPSIGRRYLADPLFNSTFIEIKENEFNKNTINFLEVDQRIYTNIESLKNEPLYILYYPGNNQIVNSLGKLKRTLHDNQDIIHNCPTTFGSTGSPILSLNTFKVIGIHSGGIKNDIEEINKGHFIRLPINELIYYITGKFK
jgi:V8-like Glu-specific endopeptidase